MVTIKQIAELAGVSRGTVDRVLNNRPGVKPETEKTIREIAKELGYYPNIAGQLLASRKKKYRILFVLYESPYSYFFEDVFHAAQQKSKELNAIGIKVDFLHVKNFTSDHLKNLFDQINLNEYDGMAIAPIIFKPVQRFIERAVEKGIPLVFYNTDDMSKKRLCYVGSDYYQAGRVAAGLTALTIGGEGTVGVITLGSVDLPSFYERLRGFKDEITANYNKIIVLQNPEYEIFTPDDYSEVYKMIEHYPDISVFYVVNAGDCRICEEIKKASGDKRTVIITNSLKPIHIDMMHKGIISATIDQQPEIQGSLPLQILYEYLVFGRLPEKDKFYTKLNIFIDQNI